MGQKLSEERPDVAKHYTLYDKLGRVRLDKDRVLAAANQYAYFKYDRLGRRVEWGRVTDTTSFLQSNADNPLFPQSGQTKEFVNTYDDVTLGASPAARGRLVKTSDIAGTNHRVMKYDEYGRLAREDITLPGLTAVQTLQYQYDRIGELSKEIYVNGATAACAYGATGQPREIRRGDSLMAGYYYRPNGAPKVVTLYQDDNSNSPCQTVDYLVWSRFR